jgi:sulfur relay (sulfurtransferase) complex TusBCD TusD component (DsrE family)
MRLSIETLNAAYYRQRALECYRLADTARAAKSLFMRLYFLAQAYDEKAKLVDSEQTAASQNH